VPFAKGGVAAALDHLAAEPAALKAAAG
jgi:hypothetical protein